MLFFVPKDGEICDEDGSLARLEEEASRDAEQKGALMQHVHVRPGPHNIFTASSRLHCLADVGAHKDLQML